MEKKKFKEEEEFKKKVDSLYNGEIEVVGKYKGHFNKILVKDKYGVMQTSPKQLLLYRPDIRSSLNKTSYFMNMLKEKYYDIYQMISPESEYIGMNTKMLFSTNCGLVSILPGALISGHMPNIRSAINRKQYFKNMLKEIYGNKYKFIIDNTDRKKGFNYLICPIHGKVEFDNDNIFTGCGCKKCSTTNATKTLFYLINLKNEKENFYKIGISGYSIRGDVKRYKQYKSLGYQIKELKIIEFSNEIELRLFELKIKHLIKPYLYTPEKWKNNTSTECFSDQVLELLFDKLNSFIL